MENSKEIMPTMTKINRVAFEKLYARTYHVKRDVVTEMIDNLIELSVELLISGYKIGINKVGVLETYSRVLRQTEQAESINPNTRIRPRFRFTRDAVRTFTELLNKRAGW